MRKSFSIGTFLFLIYIGLTLFPRGKESHVVQFRTTGFPSIDLKHIVDIGGVINKYHRDNIPHEDNAAVGLYASGLLPEYFSHSENTSLQSQFNSIGIAIQGEAKNRQAYSLDIKDQPGDAYAGNGYWFQNGEYEQNLTEKLETLPAGDLRIRQFFDDHNDSVNEYLTLISRSQHTEYFNGVLHLSSLPLIPLHRSYLKILKLRIRLALSESRITDAIQDCHAIHHLLCMLIDDVTPMHSSFALSNLPQVMAIWCEILSHPAITKEDLQDIRRRINTLPRYSGIKGLDIYERVTALGSLTSLEQHGLIYRTAYWEGTPFRDEITIFLQLGGMAFVDWDGIRDHVNQHIDNCIDILEIQDHNKLRKAIRYLKTHVVKEQFLTEGPDYPTPLNIHVFSTALVSSMVEELFLQHITNQTSRVVKHSTEDLEILHTCIAIKQFQLDHNGFPKTLEELRRDNYISEVPHDFHAEANVAYIPLKEGGLIYTVGRNKRDDQGRDDDVLFLVGKGTTSEIIERQLETIEQVNSRGSLTDEDAEVLGRTGNHNLNCLNSITDQQAESLSKNTYGLQLNGLISITDLQAESLSKVNIVSLNGLTSLTDQQAESLSKAENLHLKGLNVISDQQAESLSKVGFLNLVGLTTITDQQAASLSKVEFLMLNGLSSITDQQAKSLSNVRLLFISEDLQPLIDKYKQQ